MQMVTLGARGLRVSRLLFGTLTMGPLQRNMPVDEGAELLVYAAEKGVNFVDTAEYYQTYPYVREALKAAPGLTICTKSYAYDRDGALRSIEKAQEGVQRERIDIFLMHEQESVHTLRGHAEALATYIDFREKGIIGAVGISTHHVAGVRAAADWPGVDIIFSIINRIGLGIADGTREDMERAVEAAHAKGSGILAMKALAGGHLIGDREAAFAYAMGLQTVDAIAVGMQSKAEIDYNAALFSGSTPDAHSAKASMAAPRELIVQDWCEGCGRCVKRCGLGALNIVGAKAVVDTLRCVRCGYCAGVCPQFCLKVI